MKGLFLFLLLFFNFYNPIHPALTLVFNLILLVLLIGSSKVNLYPNRAYLLYCSLLIVIWVFFIALVNGSSDLYVLTKYMRVFVNTFILYYIVNTYTLSSNRLIKAITWIFVLHYFIILLQVIDPRVSNFMGAVMGVQRTELFDIYQNRVMGLSTGFDRASLISITGLVFFLLRYEYTNKVIFLCLSLVSALSAMQSSRLGMVISLIVIFIYIVHRVLKLQVKDIPIIISFIVMSLFFTYKLILPVIAHSFQMDILGVSSTSYDGGEYGTTGTLEAMTHNHLLPLFNLNVGSFIFGVGYDPLNTDNGYVKLIFHVGFIGSLSIILMYFYMMFQLIKMKQYNCSSDLEVVRVFLIFYMVLIMIFNYKGLLLYSRGVHDFLILLFFITTKLHRMELINKEVSSYKKNNPGFPND